MYDLRAERRAGPGNVGTRLRVKGLEQNRTYRF